MIPPSWSTALIVCLLAGSSLTACGASMSAEIRIEHPNELSRFGRRIRLESDDSAAAGPWRQALQSALVGAGYQVDQQGSPEGPAVVIAHPTMEIRGETLDSALDQCERPLQVERVIVAPSQRRGSVVTSGCANAAAPTTSAEPGETEPTLAGHRILRTEHFTESERYECVRLERSRTASAAAVVMIRRPSGTEVSYQRPLQAEWTAQTRGVYGSDAGDRAPESITDDSVAGGAIINALEPFILVVTPRTETVSVEFERCGDDRCESAVALVRAHQLPAAESLLTVVVDSLRAAHGSPDRIAAALYDRGVVRGYLRNFDAAIADVTQAIALRSGRASWESALRRIGNSRDEAAHFGTQRQDTR